MTQVTEEYGNTIMSAQPATRIWQAGWNGLRTAPYGPWQSRVKKGDFEPVGFEVSFSAIDNLKAMRIGLSEDEELQLRGRIDRMDLCEDEDHVYVKIIDYKSGTTP